MSTSSGALKNHRMHEILERVFKLQRNEHVQAINQLCVKNGSLYFKADGTFYTHDGYLPTPLKNIPSLDKNLYQELHLILSHKPENTSDYALVKSYIADCLASHPNINIAELYLDDCLVTSDKSLLDQDRFNKLNKIHAEAIDIVKRNLTMSLLKD